MVLVGFPLLALSYTHSPALVAGVAVAATAPWLLVALPAGALADRVNRRRLLVGIEAARFAILGVFAGLVLAGRSNLGVLYATVFCLNAMSAAFDVTSSAALPSVVIPRLLVKANSNLVSAQVAAQEIVGQSIGGLAFAAAASIPFVADAATFAASAALVNQAIPDNQPDTSHSSFLGDLKDGLRWFRRLPLLRVLTGLIGSFAFCQSLVVGVVALYAIRDLHMTRSGFGILLGASGIGISITAAGANQIHARLGTGWSIITAGIAAASAYAILALTHSPFTAGGALALESAGVVVGNISSRALRQSIVPQELQGRIGSAFTMAVRSAVPLGGLVGGLLAQTIGIRHTFLLAGFLQVTILALTAPKLLNALRRQSPAVQIPEQVLAA